MSQQQEADYYRRQLDQTRRELSECIDEVVFVERARAEAEHRNVSSSMKIAGLEEEIRILKQQLHSAHQHHSSPSRSSSSQQQQQSGGGAVTTTSHPGALIEENATLRGEIAALQAQQLSHTDMTLSAQRTTTSRLEQLARQLNSSENEMEMMRRRLEQAEQAERAYGTVVQERNLLEQRVGALEDLLKNPNGNPATSNNNNNKSQAQQLLAASQALAATSNTAATSSQLIELRNQIEQMARDATQRQAQVDAAVQRLSSTERERNNADGHNNSHNQQPLGFASPSSANNNNSNSMSQNERTKLHAFEKTVQTLNLELASMEQKLREMEALYNDQQQRFALARKDFEADQRECDQVVAAMAAELEQLMDDNAKLRQRLRSKTQEAVAVENNKS